jgi:hypothetical protein
MTPIITEIPAKKISWYPVGPDSVGTKNFRAVTVDMGGLCPLRQIAVHKDAQYALKGGIGGFGFLYGKKGKLPCPAGLTQGGGGVKGVKVSGLGKNNGNNVIFRKAVFFQQGIV